MTNRNFVGLLESPEQMAMVLELLGLPPEAMAEQVVEAIRALVGGGEEEVPVEENPVGLPMQESEPTPDPRIAVLEAELAQLQGFNKNLEHEKLVISYAKRAESWVTMSGTAEERGEELAAIHESAGKETANKVVNGYQMAHEGAERAGVLESLGATHREDTTKPDSFHDEVEEYAEKHDMTFEKALTVKAQEKPSEYAAYNKRVKVSMGGK